MNKSTILKVKSQDQSTPASPEPNKSLPTSPDKQTIDNIIAFSHAYSVRRGKAIDKMEFVLN